MMHPKQRNSFWQRFRARVSVHVAVSGDAACRRFVIQRAEAPPSMKTITKCHSSGKVSLHR